MIIVDKEVVKGIKGGIFAMYVDLVRAGEKNFADNILQENKESKK